MAIAGVLTTYGKRQRVLREDMGLTQSEFAERVTAAGASMKQAYVSELERTDKVPVGDVVAAVAKVLGTTADFLLMVTDDPLRPGADRDIYFTREAGEAAVIIDSFEDEVRREIVRWLQWFQTREGDRRLVQQEMVELQQEVATLLRRGAAQFGAAEQLVAERILQRLPAGYRSRGDQG